MIQLSRNESTNREKTLKEKKQGSGLLGSKSTGNLFCIFCVKYSVIELTQPTSILHLQSVHFVIGRKEVGK